MKNIKLYILMLLIGASYSSQAADKPAKNSDYYEKYFTFKKGKVFSYDPYVWAYTKEFSERFEMPKKWIDNNLKGMMAVAFRMTTVGTLNCGYGKNENSCWPPLKCQMDIYYDKKIKLPWTRDEIRRDFLQRGLYSTDYLLYSKPRGIREYPKQFLGFGVLESGGKIQVGKFHSMKADIKFFDRDFDDGVGFISYTGLGVCPKITRKGYMNIYDKETDNKLRRNIINKKEAKPMHVFEFSEGFMTRANSVYNIKNKGNVEVTKQLLKEFKDSMK